MIPNADDTSARSLSYESIDGDVAVNCFSEDVNAEQDDNDNDGWYVKGALPLTFPRQHQHRLSASSSSEPIQIDSDKEDDTLSYVNINFPSNDNTYEQNDNDASLAYKRSTMVVNRESAMQRDFDVSDVRDMGKLLSRLNKSRKSLSELDIASLVAAEKCGLGGVDALTLDDDDNGLDFDEDEEKVEEGKANGIGYEHLILHRYRRHANVIDDEAECKEEESNDDVGLDNVSLPEHIDVSDPSMHSLMLESVLRNRVNVVRKLHRAGVPLQTRLFRSAAKHGKVGVLQYLLVQVSSASLRQKLVRVAQQHASTQTLQFLRRNYVLQ